VCVLYILQQSVTGSSIMNITRTKVFVLVRISYKPMKIFKLCMSSTNIAGFVLVKVTRALRRFVSGSFTEHYDVSRLCITFTFINLLIPEQNL
jgi:hypothetical protein